jgi:hypothetical protein
MPSRRFPPPWTVEDHNGRRHRERGKRSRLLVCRFKTADDDVVGLDAERVLNGLGGLVAIVAFDCLFENVGHALQNTSSTSLKSQ